MTSLPLLSPWVGRKWFTWTLAPTCLNFAVLVNSSQAAAQGPSFSEDGALADLASPKPCVHWARLIGLNCHPHFPSVLPASVTSGNYVLLSIFYLKHLDSQLLFFNCGDWTSPTITWSSQTHLSDYTIHHYSHSLQERDQSYTFVVTNAAHPVRQQGSSQRRLSYSENRSSQWSQITNGNTP